MHKMIIAKATDEQIREFATDYITMLKSTQPQMYKEAEKWLYKEVFGNHFNESTLECALQHMLNEDGTTGGHWTVAQTNQVAYEHSVKLSSYNEYDWNYVMNMMYSDYCSLFGNEVNYYFKLSKAFLCDKDAPEGKAYLYYLAMHCE